MTIDFDKLAQEKEKASEDKVDLFDFYHANWYKLISALRLYQALEYSDGCHHEFHTSYQDDAQLRCVHCKKLKTDIARHA